MKALRVRQLSAPLGVEIELDLSQAPNPEVMAAIQALYAEHHLLLFRDQQLGEAAQVAFARHFGPISRRSPAMAGRDSVLVSNSEPGGILGDGELLFHSDNTFFAHPLKAIGLYAIEVPASGGDTIFANCRAAYRRLPAALRQQIDGLRSFQVFDYGGDHNRRPSFDTAPPDAPRATHPLVWTDPVSREPVLFFSEHTTARINGVPPEAEAGLMATLRDSIADPAVTYRHRWQAGDFLFWDNIVLQHARTDFERGARRTLRRTPVLDPDGETRFPHSRTLTAELRHG